MTRVLNAGTSLTGRRQIRGGGLAFLLGYFCHLERGKTHRVPGAKVMSKAATIWCSHFSQQYSGRTSNWQGPSSSPSRRRWPQTSCQEPGCPVGQRVLLSLGKWDCIAAGKCQHINTQTRHPKSPLFSGGEGEQWE